MGLARPTNVSALSPAERRVVLTEEDEEAVVSIPNGMSAEEIVRIAINNVSGRAMRYAVRATLRGMGVGLEDILRPAVDALGAVSDKGPSHLIRLKASELLMKASGILTPDPNDEPRPVGAVRGEGDRDTIEEISRRFLEQARARLRGSSEEATASGGPAMGSYVGTDLLKPREGGAFYDNSDSDDTAEEDPGASGD